MNVLLSFVFLLLSVCLFALPNDISAICLLKTQVYLYTVLFTFHFFLSLVGCVSFYFLLQKCAYSLSPSPKHLSNLLIYKLYTLGKQNPKSVTILYTVRLIGIEWNHVFSHRIFDHSRTVRIYFLVVGCYVVEVWLWAKCHFIYKLLCLLFSILAWVPSCCS